MGPPTSARLRTKLLRASGIVAAIAASGLLAIALAVTGCASTPRVPEADRLPAYDDAPWARVLDAAVVGEEGLVDYAELAEGTPARDDLTLYLNAVARFGPESTPNAFATEADRLAYHLNAYNAFMLQKWLEKGAATADADERVGWLTWFFDRFAMDGGSESMHALEQGLIRPTYGDARIHFALVCGALSCPPLLDEPYRGPELDRQFRNVATRWLQAPDGLVVGDDGTVTASRILDWYAGDFDGGEPFDSLADMFEAYLPAGPRRDAAVAAADAGELRFMGYDWTINSPAASAADAGG
ncbi:DUF547 domain-containing protein [Phycisphaera mikurensis]|uniref:DUF547 domain-containing protein n=1 Tax=Phycisphaera mikurensis (strain NBRC 102666 / KCTC 22515 / FYK2301M01) TaxID=1142394 RepID=I0IGG2_PHYMF|nr:DUF547 domain-containing protein [Phycisphaera mikurensis]MBB6442967.1 hypothetical protein [Phycisphaera mikurensis]BAM04350.1 hypothetical protein PSMK_21910 [Phycisphaera mikurensis NBRC 102666]